VYIVADGLGGHEHGDIASQAAVRTMSAHLMAKYYEAFFGIIPANPEESVREILESGVAKAHRVVEQRAPEGGTTLTTVLIIGNRMSIAHVGDSRAYIILPDGRMKRQTRDHSWVEKLIEIGQLTPEEAETHPKKHDLYRALAPEVSGEPDITTSTLTQSGYLLVCSDGLWNVVPEADIARLVTTAPNLQTACAKLVESANAAGGPDNISVILVQLTGS
jgi:protein phosphatase